MIKRIQIINAPLPSLYMESSRTGCYPPLHMAALAGYLHKYCPEIQVEIIDGEITDTFGVVQHLDAPMIGISCNIMTYQSALGIAEMAYEKGSRVILGGPFPSSMPETILRNRYFVDAIVVGDGELALSKYLYGENYEKIAGLAYRKKDGSIASNPPVTLDLNELPLPDYCNLPMAKYFEDYNERYSQFKPFSRSLATYSRKGCIWRDVSNGGCVFCMIPHSGVRYKRPEKLWNEIRHFYELYGVDHFWEVCDTFTEDDKWIKEFLATKPLDLDVSFQIYGRSNHITSRMARQLKELGVYEVFIGAESGDDTILKFTNKGCTVDHTRRAVETLANEGINTIVSFVFGLPGETSKTLQKTVDLAKALYEFGNIVETSASILLPIPGSTSFKVLMEIPGMAARHGSDLLDLEELKIDWCNNYTFVTYEEINDALRQTLEIFPLNDTFEQKNLQSAPIC